MNSVIPVVLFAYARPEHLKLTLACLRENNVPLIYAFSDGPKTPEAAGRVNEVRQILREIDWCEVHLVERTENLGLGKSILTGVSEVLQQHDAIIVFEDDLICVPGTYQYLCSALARYENDLKVVSITGFNHPLNTPPDIVDQPYFDGRTDCLVWGAWSRSWGEGMQRSALELMAECEKRGIDIFRYGATLPALAKTEIGKNTWAVRFTYWHILNGGLCLRPPYSMVEHIGFDNTATNAPVDLWDSPPLKDCPPIPDTWPEPIEHPDCSRIWQEVDGSGPNKSQSRDFAVVFAGKLSKLRRLAKSLRDLVNQYLNITGKYDGTISKK